MAQQALLESRSKNVRRLTLTPELILELLKVPVDGALTDSGVVVSIVDAIPTDAKALRCGITDDGNINLLIEHGSFASIAEGQLIPILQPVYEVYREHRDYY